MATARQARRQPAFFKYFGFVLGRCGRDASITVARGGRNEKAEPSPTPKPCGLDVPPIRAESRRQSIDHHATWPMTIAPHHRQRLLCKSKRHSGFIPVGRL